jgi:hypothetical protein
LQALVRKVDAAGMQIAHTGCVAGFVFPAGANSGRSITQAHKGLAAIGIVKTWRFKIGKNGTAVK